MHLIIASRIAEEFSFDDKTSFLLGGIAPDAITPKDASHFYAGDVMDYTRFIDYHGFFEKYKHYKDSAFILGYYTHLIADDIWLKGFYLPWLRNRMSAKPEILTMYHNDFRLFNAKLLNHYDLEQKLLELIKNKSYEIIDLDEVKASDIEAFVPHVLDDMHYPMEHLDQPLEVFTMEQIIGYVETSVDKSILHMKKLNIKNSL